MLAILLTVKSQHYIKYNMCENDGNECRMFPVFILGMLGGTPLHPLNLKLPL